MSVWCKFKCMYINPAFCRVRATGGTQIVPHLPSGEQVTSRCLLWYHCWCVHFSVLVTSFVYQLRNTWCAGITWYFYTCCILGNCEHLFQSESSCQIFLSLQCMVDFPQSKIFLVCLRWPKGDFPAISPPQICPTDKESSCLPLLSYYVNGLFSLLFSVCSCSSYSHGKGNSVFSLAFGKPLSEAFLQGQHTRATASLTHQELIKEPDV